MDSLSYQPPSGEQRRGGYTQPHGFGDPGGASTHSRYITLVNKTIFVGMLRFLSIEKRYMPIPCREQNPGYGSDDYIPPACPSREQDYCHSMQQGSLPIKPRE